MRVLHRRLLVFGAVALALVPVLFGIRLLDRMALAYTTGLRRSVDSPGFGGVMPPADGPPPGVAFIGFSQPAEDAEGFVMRRVTAQGREAGLRNGDRVTAVDGVAYRDAREAMGGLISTRIAGETVDLTVVRSGEELTLPLRLSRYVRHPGDLGLVFEEVALASGSGHTLRGWWIPPPGDSDGRAVVWVHGAHSSRYQALDHGAEFLHDRGYGILTMDLSGRGSSDGEYITYTWNERHDVRSMVRYLRSRPDADASRVVVFGTSNGAASAMYAAAELGDLPALALDAPYADLWRAAGSMLEMRGGIPALRGPLALFVRMRTGLRIREVRPVEVVDEIPGPVLFVHGDRDRQVPPEHSLELHDARLAAGLPSRRWILPGGEHGFDDYPPPGIFWNRIADFFDDALGGRPPGRELGGPVPDTLDDPAWTGNGGAVREGASEGEGSR
ncbi:MAG: prolyl oligopeptidase family serine peptidase [Acidobacteria bacterium]|nr:prolyl oligopeptidase family serine peptidase [Acidobacteriota bacterium]